MSNLLKNCLVVAATVFYLCVKSADLCQRTATVPETTSTSTSTTTTTTTSLGCPPLESLIADATAAFPPPVQNGMVTVEQVTFIRV
uniref:Uncharacterized protein n=1 Tax=Plectus sambesii TaxID=2011161 RepID=A0A914UZ49_9BILA